MTVLSVPFWTTGVTEIEDVEETGAVVLAKLAELATELATELSAELAMVLAAELDSDETVAWVEAAFELVSAELSEELEDSVAALEASEVEVEEASVVEAGTAVAIPSFASASEIAPINLVEYHGTPVIILVTSSPEIPVNMVVKSPPAKTALAISGGYVSVLCKAWKA